MKPDIPKSFYVLLLLFITLPYNLHAQEENENTLEECNQFLKKGNYLVEKGDYSHGFEYLTKAEALATRNNWIKELIDIKNNIGIAYSSLSNYGEAMGYYIQALDLSKNMQGLEEYSLSIMNNIAFLYSQEEDYASALHYYKEAYKIAKEKKIDRLVLAIAINTADIYNVIGDYREARKYLTETKNIDVPEEMYYFFWRLNYAETYYLEGNINQAIEDLQMLTLEVDPHKYGECYVLTVKLLSKIYAQQNNSSMALLYANKGLKNKPVLRERIKLYQQLAIISFKNGDYLNYQKYNDSLFAAKDSLVETINRNLFESNKVKLRVQEYQNQLKSTSEKYTAERRLFVIGIILCLALFFFIYRSQKNKIIKQKQEKIILERNQEIVNLELEKKIKEQQLVEKQLEAKKDKAQLKQEVLKNEVAEKNRELSAKALHLSIRNGLIETAINSLIKIPEVSKNSIVAGHIRTLRTHLKDDNEWEDFITHFEKVNPVFITRLKQKHPNLNAKDIRFICCVYMNLDIKEIGNIFNITYNAAKKRKLRVKEKMGVNHNFPLYEYLLQIN